MAMKIHNLSRFTRLLPAVLIMLAPSLLFAGEIVKGGTLEKGNVVASPCGLRLTLSDNWVPAPQNVFSAPGNRGFMVGRMGIKGSNGKGIVPTLSVLWEPVDYVETDPKNGKDVDPLFHYVMNNRPDYQSNVFKLDKMFIWENGPLTLKYAYGFQYSAVLDGRPSKAILIMTLNKKKRLGVKVFVEVPDDVYPGLEKELNAILKSIEMIRNPGV